MRLPLATFLPLLMSVCALGQQVQGLKFIQNKGQWNPELDYQALVPGGRVGLSPTGFSIMLLDLKELEHRHMEGHQGHVNEWDGQPADEPINGHYFRIELVGSNPNATAHVDNPLEGHYNYFLGNDSRRWASKAKAFGTVTYKDVYDRIDFRISSVGSDLKYDFIVHPGGDASIIKIQYVGVDGVELTPEDGLEIRTSQGELQEQRPYSYQSDGIRTETVRSEYSLRNNIATFFFPDGYDESRELVIDPLLIFSTYSGSTADNWGSTATPGEHGTLYSAGVTTQAVGGFFPTTTGAFQTSHQGNFDMAVIKYDSSGTRFIYATLLGGTNNDTPESLVVDKASGDLIVLGISSSPDYPTSSTAFDGSFNGGPLIFNRVINTTDGWDIVVTRLAPDGSQLVGSTFLGGTGNDGLNLPKQSGGPLVVNYGDEMRGDVITDEAGNVYVSSVTGSGDFPIVGGFDDTFNGGTTDGLVVKLTPDLSSIVWSSYVGGSGFDASYSIKFDNAENLVIAGGTTSTDFPVTAGSYQTQFNGVVDGWIARISSDGGSILHATFTGTTSFDQVYFIDLNSKGEVFCYGQTTGHMPITIGVFSNVNSGQFLQKFSPDLSTLRFSTVFGSGSSSGLVIPNISPTAFLVNDCDNIYMSGWGGFVNSSTSTGFWPSSTVGMPITNDAYQKTTSGSDFYFIVLNGDASKLVYSTYLGGGSSATHVDGGTSRFDKYGIVYHAVCSGCTFGNTTGGATSDFPTTPNAKSRLNRSQNCNNAAFKFDLSSLRALFDTNNMELTMPGFNNVCHPDTIVFENHSTGGRIIEWDFDDGTVVTQLDTEPRFVIHKFHNTGSYHVKLTITDLSTCSQTDSFTKTIKYFVPNITVTEDAAICEGASFQLTASGGSDYAWSSEDGTFSSTQASPFVSPESSTTYYVTVVDANGCSKKDTVQVDVTLDVRAAFQSYDITFTQPNYNNVCFPNAIRFKNQSVNGESYIWDLGDGLKVPQSKEDTVSLLHLYQNQGVYIVKLKAFNPNTCNKVDSVTKAITYFRPMVSVGEDGEVCEGTSFRLTASGGSTYTWTTEDGGVVSTSQSPLVTPAKTTEYFVTVTDSHDCSLTGSIVVAVLDSVLLDWEHAVIANCTDRPFIYVENRTPEEDDVTFQFDFGDGVTSTERTLQHTYENDGWYTLRLSGQRKFCNYEESVQLPIYKLLVPNVFTPEDSPGDNDTFAVVLGSSLASPSDVGIPVQLVVVNRWGNVVYESSDYRNDWAGKGLEDGIYYVNLKVGNLATCKTWLHIVK